MASPIPIRRLAISPDSRSLAVCLDDPARQAFVLDVAGREPARVMGGQTIANDLAWSPNGERLVLAQEKYRTTCSDLAGAEIWQYHPNSGHSKMHRRVAWSPDGRLVALAVETEQRRCENEWKSVDVVVLVDAHTGTEVGTVEHGPRISQVLFAAGGLFASVGVGLVRMWDLADRRPLWSAEGVGKAVFSPDGRVIAVGDLDLPLRLLDAETGTDLRVLGAGAPVCFAEQGGQLVRRGRKGALAIIDVRGRHEARELPSFSGAEGPFAPSADGRLVLSCSTDGSILIQDVLAGTDIGTLTLTDGGHWLVRAADGRWDASPGADLDQPTARRVSGLLATLLCPATLGR